ncbi:YceH family protein [Shewanella salipaludis]|uniref:DUF480 domain-containing protein n=1 Tax=Shewanella salipaludis TaxID=2723052 RepID=A0A972FXI3_9GAMM|nr:DUF480 domain-containing protein [Shewanella salipaludis]NMH63736.1 DUF480 domain-containing protein [Shewanella salipaludis]
MQLTSHEARVIGCLLEKEVTTPEQYPLSLNALTLACNQKSSRDPVLELSETQVQASLDSLAKRRLISEQSGFGSRVIKYQHRFCNTEFGELQLTAAQLAIVCLLLLRGPQTAGELRTRSNRLYNFKDIAEVEQTLSELMRAEPPMLGQLPREPGKRECRFEQLFSGSVSPAGSPKAQVAPVDKLAASDTAADTGEAELVERVARLEQQLAQLTEQVALLLAAAK